MAKKKTEVVEETIEQPKVDDTVEKIKVKKKPSMKKFSNDPDGITKVDLSNPPKTDEDTVKEDTEQETTNVVTDKPTETVQEVVEEVSSEQDTVQDEVTPVIEEITDEEQIDKVSEKVEETITEAEVTGKPIPENIQKLMDFMEETGGDLNDYVKLNQDYSKLENQDLLYEYYKQTKPHLNNEEINFLMEDRFSYDEEVDEERDIKRKKLALKEQVANAKTHLEENKSKYYEDIKAGSKLTPEQQKAINFFNRYNKDQKSNQKLAKKNTEVFEQKTNNLFNDKFKGFEYSVGDKKFRFNVKDVDSTKTIQSDLNGFLAKFVDKDLSLTDAKGYHKSLFTAMNADAIANHFYEQGKTDAMKTSVAKAKNVNMDPRQSHGTIEAGGIKVKVLGDDSSDFKFKIKNRK